MNVFAIYAVGVCVATHDGLAGVIMMGQLGEGKRGFRAVEGGGRDDGAFPLPPSLPLLISTSDSLFVLTIFLIHSNSSSASRANLY